MGPSASTRVWDAAKSGSARCFRAEKGLFGEHHSRDVACCIFCLENQSRAKITFVNDILGVQRERLASQHVRLDERNILFPRVVNMDVACLSC